MRRRPAGLWHDADFIKLWIGQAISRLGSQVMLFALPLTAVLTLQATPIQMGILEAAGALPSLLLGLFAGALVDRFRRRPILIAADLGQAALLLLIPIAAVLHALRVEHLYATALVCSTLGLFSGAAHGPFLLAQPVQ